ncbi:hypothetical protein ACLPHM_05975 [Paenalcaligenes sp. Me131]|uniref:hypothetical protein n=1 Tax=Paenalcaligenes sp. Me131 TaxID=3392636 RepID=UPI003D2E2FEA
MTQTERLPQQAKSICAGVTENSEISDQLLCSVFERLCVEQDMREPTEPLQHSHDLH